MLRCMLLNMQSDWSIQTARAGIHPPASVFSWPAIMAGAQLIPYYKHQHDIEWQELIGTGAFGSVYKVKVDGHNCAVKKISQPSLPDSKTLARFQQECKLMYEIRHDNIVQCLDIRNDGQHLVLVMELMERNLHEFLELSPPLFYVQVDIVGNIFQALAYLHRKDVIHRDLSSANILMKGNFAKVSDFGMARLHSTFNSYKLTRCPGNRCYMPPEALDECEYNETIDVFSGGILIIQIMTRKNPEPTERCKTGPNEMEIRVKEIDRRCAHINECSNDNPLKPIALWCLADAKERRPQASTVCAKIIELQQLEPYQSNREKGMQLALWNKTAIIRHLEDQNQKIETLHYQMAELKKQYEGVVVTLTKSTEHFQGQIMQYEGVVRTLQSQMAELQASKKVDE